MLFFSPPEIRLTRGGRNAKITGGRAQTNFVICNMTHVLPWTLKLPSGLYFCVFCHVSANTQTAVIMTGI